MINKQKSICVGITGMVLVFLVECCQKIKWCTVYGRVETEDLVKNKWSLIAFLSSVCTVPSCMLPWQSSSCTEISGTMSMQWILAVARDFSLCQNVQTGSSGLSSLLLSAFPGGWTVGHKADCWPPSSIEVQYGAIPTFSLYACRDSIVTFTFISFKWSTLKDWLIHPFRDPSSEHW